MARNGGFSLGRDLLCWLWSGFHAIKTGACLRSGQAMPSSRNVSGWHYK
jgi:hypothetical protein